MSNFQEEIRDDHGYEDVVIIAVGQSNTSGFNSSFCSNSDLPLVIDPYPSLPIREQFGESSFNEFHKSVIILGHDGEYLGQISVNSVTAGVKNCGIYGVSPTTARGGLLLSNGRKDQ